MKQESIAKVVLWGKTVGAVYWSTERNMGVFQYHPDFLRSDLDISPIHMPLEDARRGDGIYSFPELNKQTFYGLPGMLADSLPDKYGHAIIDAWLARQGLDSTQFDPVQRLCYTHTRGMGALEFYDGLVDEIDQSIPLEISALTKLAQKIMSERKNFQVNLAEDEHENQHAILDILRVGTSAGGARPKAVIAMNGAGKVRSGQAQAPKGYDYWILKFDGVSDLELGEPHGYGRIEYAYYLMAKAAGIEMTECKLIEENGRAHFITKRFDRNNNEKIHLQSLCGIAHYDFNMAGAYSYEQAFALMRKLHLSQEQITQLYRRMIFNIAARNLDDHTKNISFLMYPDGTWKLSPAYDMTFAHNPKGLWTNQHQMSIAGKRDQFTHDDLLQVARSNSIHKAEQIIAEVLSAVADWSKYAITAVVNPKMRSEIGRYHRLDI